MTIIEVVLVLVITDTVIGICAQAQQHSLKSSLGRQHLTQKIAELIAIAALQIVSYLDSEHFPAYLVQYLYVAFGFFELISIAENLNALGLISDQMLHWLRIQDPIDKKEDQK